MNFRAAAHDRDGPDNRSDRSRPTKPRRRESFEGAPGRPQPLVSATHDPLTMLLTITNTQPPATDLGYLLHKNPARLQSFDLSFGSHPVFYPVATEESCT